ncbi:hypothetical protein [Catenulispora acidiphila]|uniref:hypothetical protein n=1 Tax=Catenulispora acidiphila TaxID=304895 RepID=UPI00167FE22E|nr:hypothetical protein [Catenulispora acidiphila]
MRPGATRLQRAAAIAKSSSRSHVVYESSYGGVRLMSAAVLGSRVWFVVFVVDIFVVDT